MLLDFLPKSLALGGLAASGEDPSTLLGAIMFLASGGILYLIFQDIATQVILRKHRGPPLAAVLGFALAMLGSVLNV